eukprot:956890_1
MASNNHNNPNTIHAHLTYSQQLQHHNQNQLNRLQQMQQLNQMNRLNNNTRPLIQSSSQPNQFNLQFQIPSLSHPPVQYVLPVQHVSPQHQHLSQLTVNPQRMVQNNANNFSQNRTSPNHMHLQQPQQNTMMHNNATLNPINLQTMYNQTELATAQQLFNRLQSIGRDVQANKERRNNITRTMIPLYKQLQLYHVNSGLLLVSQHYTRYMNIQQQITTMNQQLCAYQNLYNQLEQNLKNTQNMYQLNQKNLYKVTTPATELTQRVADVGVAATAPPSVREPLQDAANDDIMALQQVMDPNMTHEIHTSQDQPQYTQDRDAMQQRQQRNEDIDEPQEEPETKCEHHEGLEAPQLIDADEPQEVSIETHNAMKEEQPILDIQKRDETQQDLDPQKGDTTPEEHQYSVMELVMEQRHNLEINCNLCEKIPRSLRFVSRGVSNGRFMEDVAAMLTGISCATLMSHYTYNNYWNRMHLICSGYLRSCRIPSDFVEVTVAAVPIVSFLNELCHRPSHHNEPLTEPQQTALTTAFDPQLLQKIKFQMYEEATRLHIDPDIVHWDNFLKSHRYNLSQRDYTQELSEVREDPARIALFLCRCIQNIKNKRHQLSKAAQNDFNFIENMNYNYASSHTQKHHENSGQLRHDIHYLLTHLSFKHNLIFDFCTYCCCEALGRIDCYDRHFYCLQCLPPYRQFTPVLRSAYKEAPDNQCKGKVSTLTSIKKSYAEEFQNHSLFERYGSILALQDMLSQTESFALLVKYGVGAFLLHTLHCLQANHVLGTDGWIDESCQDNNAYEFQQISMDWIQEFRDFGTDMLGLTPAEVNRWIHTKKEDTRYRKGEIPWRKYFNCGRPNAIGFLSFLNNALIHYNTMFGKRFNENEYGIWSKLLRGFKGSIRFIVKLESSLQTFVVWNRSYAERTAPACVKLLESLKSELGEMYYLTKACSVDYVGYNLFIYGLEQLNRRQYPGYRHNIDPAMPRHIDVDAQFFGAAESAALEDDMKRIEVMKNESLVIADEDWTQDHAMLLNMRCDQSDDRMFDASGTMPYDSDYGSDHAK